MSSSHHVLFLYDQRNHILLSYVTVLILALNKRVFVWSLALYVPQLHSDPLVIPLQCEGWMVSHSASSAACSAARPVPAALLPSSPSCLPSPHMPSFQNLRQAPLHREQLGLPACGGAAVHQFQGPEPWRADGSFTWQSEQSFSIRRESWTRQRSSSLDPVEETESAACTSAVSLMPGG